MIGVQYRNMIRPVNGGVSGQPMQVPFRPSFQGSPQQMHQQLMNSGQMGSPSAQMTQAGQQRMTNEQMQQYAAMQQRGQVRPMNDQFNPAMPPPVRMQHSQQIRPGPQGFNQQRTQLVDASTAAAYASLQNAVSVTNGQVRFNSSSKSDPKPLRHQPRQPLSRKGNLPLQATIRKLDLYLHRSPRKRNKQLLQSEPEGVVILLTHPPLNLGQGVKLSPFLRLRKRRRKKKRRKKRKRMKWLALVVLLWRRANLLLRKSRKGGPGRRHHQRRRASNKVISEFQKNWKG